MFNKYKQYILLTIVLSSISAAFYAGVKYSQYRYDSDTKIRLEAQIEAQRHLDNALYEVSARTQEAISNIRVENRNIYNEVRTEILEKPIYNECIIPMEGVDLINRARRSYGEPQ